MVQGIVPTLIIIRSTAIHGPPGVYSVQRNTGLSWGNPSAGLGRHSSHTACGDGTLPDNEMAMDDFKIRVDCEEYKSGRIG